MTRTWCKRRGSVGPKPAMTRAEWRALVALARRCVTDVREAETGTDAEFRRMSLVRQSAAGATSTVLDREAGATLGAAGRAFLTTCEVFARAQTPGALREALAPVVEAHAVFLDDQLHALNAEDFRRAHAGRPEVMG